MLSSHEHLLLEDYKHENKIDQMTIIWNSGKINDSRLKQLDDICEDIWSINHYSQSFLFVLSYISNINLDSIEHPISKKQIKQWIDELKTGELKHNNLMQEMIGIYITFEKHLMHNRISSIIEMDEKAVEGDIKQKYEKDIIIHREIADDSFFVYQKCAIRAMYTLNMSTAWAIVNIIMGSLTDDIFPYLNSKISLFMAKTKTQDGNKLFAFALRNNEEKQRAGFSPRYTLYNACLIAYLNSYQTCIDYIEKLKQQLTSELDGLLSETESSFEDYKYNFTQSGTHSLHSQQNNQHVENEAGRFFQKDMFRTSLDFCGETQKQWNEEINEKINWFLNSPDFSELLDNMLKELAKLDLNLDDKKYEEYDADDPFFHKFWHAIQKILNQWTNQLLSDLFDKFIKCFTTYIADNFLKIALLGSTQKLSLLGALYLGKC